MAYSVYGDVSSEFKGMAFGASTTPTSTEVTEFIAQADAEIDARLGVKYVTPISGTKSLVICKILSIKISAQRVRDVIAVKSGNKEVDSEAGTNSKKEALAMINDILNDRLLLSDATSNSSQDGFASFNVDNNEEFEMKKGTNQW